MGTQLTQTMIEAIAVAAVELQLAERRWGQIALLDISQAVRAYLVDGEAANLVGVDLRTLAASPALVPWLTEVHRTHPAPAFFEALEALGLPTEDDPAVLAPAIARLPDPEAILEWLHRERSLDFACELAGDLDSLGNPLPQSVSNAATAAANHAAVILGRRLAAQVPGIRASLGTMLRNLGADLSVLGRWDEALAADEEAIELFRATNALDSDRYRGELAAVLVGRGSSLLRMGRETEAIACTREGLAVYRLHREKTGDEVDFTENSGLSNLAGMLMRSGELAEALEISRRLVAAHRASSDGRLGRALALHGGILNALGRDEEAEATLREAVEFFRTTADVNLEHFGITLNHMASLLIRLDRREDALPLLREATQVLTEAAATALYVDANAVSFAFEELVTCLRQTNRPWAAVHVAEEAVGALEGLTGVDMALVDALFTLQHCLGDVGEIEKSFEVLEEAEQIIRERAAQAPEAWLPQLMRVRTRGSFRLGQLGRHEEALAASQEAIQLEARVEPDAHRAGLRRLVLGDTLADLGRHAEALEAARSAEHAFRAQLEAEPDVVSEFLPMALGDIAEHLASLERYGEALEASDVACAWLDEQPAPLLDRLQSQHSRQLWIRSSILEALGDTAGARVAIYASLDTVWPLFIAQPERHGSVVWHSLQRCAEMGPPTIALAARMREHRRLYPMGD